MLELIKNYHQRSAIFLRKVEGNFTVASFVLFDQLNNAKLLGQKTLNREELEGLLTQREILEIQNIFIIEEPEQAPIMFLEAKPPKVQYAEIESLIPSPYISYLFREAEFFSTQKTRGPNK